MQVYHWNWHIITQSLPFLAGGILTTIGVCAGAALLTIPVSLLGAAGRLSSFKPFNTLAKLYVDVFRSTPFLVQLVWFFFALPILIDYELTGVQASIIALALYIGAYQTEVIRSGILSLEGGQKEAAYALGMTPWQAYVRIILPQAMSRMVPPSLSNLIDLIKQSATVSAVSVADLTWRAASIASRSYRPLEPVVFPARVYMGMLLPLVFSAR